MWLDGFLAGRKTFASEDLELIRQKMTEVQEEAAWAPCPGYNPYPYTMPWYATSGYVQHDIVGGGNIGSTTTTTVGFCATYGPDN